MTAIPTSASSRACLRLAILLLLAHPVRMSGMALLVGAFLVAATIAIAAVVTVGLAYAYCVIARYFLPADRLEGRVTIEVEPHP